MILTCTACTNGVNSAGSPCEVCGGDGEFSLLDDGFRNTQGQWPLQGVLWDKALTALEDLTSKVDDVMDKCNDIMDKCNDIKEKVDEL